MTRRDKVALTLGAVVLGLGLMAPGRRRPGLPDSDREALARLLTSETSNERAWPWIAWTAANKVQGGGLPSLEYLLKRGVRDSDRETVVGLGWGPQKGDGYTRWASSRQEPSRAALAFADRFLVGNVPDPGTDGATSFFEGDAAAAAAFERRNPELVLVESGEGWRFYRKRAS